jgi:hypothetical protein
MAAIEDGSRSLLSASSQGLGPIGELNGIVAGLAGKPAGPGLILEAAP